MANMLEKGRQAQAELDAGVVVRTASDIRSRATNFFPPLEVIDSIVQQQTVQLASKI